VPAFRLKKDVFPNRERIAWFIATKVGEYDIACSEYCGLNHSYMYSKIFVLSEQDFMDWQFGLNTNE
jgi:cytochrome c oxidase subunit 2